MLTVVADEAAREDLAASLDEIAREGARRLLTAALEEEVAGSRYPTISGVGCGPSSPRPNSAGR
jgi:hypothetical protein